jgi:glutathione-regulated potassium-efflux system ancillary protein KefF
VASILALTAHPYPSRSRGHRALLTAIRSDPGVEVRALYDLYPDFDIDVPAEQAALETAGLVIWMHPLYWYGVPAILKHWFDRVLTNNWAHGKGGTKLHGKDCLWVTTTGGDTEAYSSGGRHERPFAEFVAPVEQTARYCGMTWLEPFTVHGVNTLDDAALAAEGDRLRARLASWRGRTP